MEKLKNSKIGDESLLQNLRSNNHATIGKVEMIIKGYEITNEIIISGRDISAHLLALEK